jgi:peptide/nickel transport system substrate-binding protein
MVIGKRGMIRRRAVAVVASAALATTATACGGDDNGTSSENSSATSVEDSTAGTEAPGTSSENSSATSVEDSADGTEAPGTTSDVSSSDTGNTVEIGGTVTVALDSPVATLDPAKGATTTDANLQWALYDTLVYLDPDGEVVAGLATSWESTATSATFTLKGGVTCSDGTELDAEMVAASLNRFFDPETAARGLGFSIGPGNTGTATADPAQNSVTVEITNPWPGLVRGLAAPATGVVCPAGIDDAESLSTSSSGTGPYVVDELEVGVSYTLSRRSDYNWGPQFSSVAGTAPATLIYRVVTSENTAANLLDTGEVDIATFGGTEGDSLASADGFSSEIGLQRDAFLIFNQAEGRVTADPAVRKAIVQAIDRAGLINVLGDGNALEIVNLGQPTYDCYDATLEADIAPPDPEAAAAVLDGLDIKVLGSISYANGNGTTYIQAALNAAGANAVANNVDAQIHAADLFGGSGDWDVTILGLTNISNDILSSIFLLSGAAPPNGSNVGAIANPDADAYYADAVSTTGDSSCAATSNMQRAYIDANDVIPLAALPRNVVFGDGLSSSIVKGVVVPGSIRTRG